MYGEIEPYGYSLLRKITRSIKKLFNTRKGFIPCGFSMSNKLYIIWKRLGMFD